MIFRTFKLILNSNTCIYTHTSIYSYKYAGSYTDYLEYRRDDIQDKKDAALQEKRDNAAVKIAVKEAEKKVCLYVYIFVCINVYICRKKR
jgi:hypothetical protein